MSFVKIKDPDKPGDYLILAASAYDPAKHRLFVAEEPLPAEATEPADEPKKRTKKGA